MGMHRWVAGAVALCTLVGCKHWDWSLPPQGVPEVDDCTQHSVKESVEFYEKLLPPRGFYQIFAIPEPHDATTVPTRLPYSFVVVRVRDARNPDTREPLIERIIGPVRSKEEWEIVFSVFRRYASAPPAGYYCWQDDCRGKFSPAGDPDPLDPYPPEIPDHAGIVTPAGVVTQTVPAGSYLLREVEHGRGIGGSGLEGANGGGQCKFVPRGTTLLTGEIIEKLRTSARGVGAALDAVPEIPNAPPRPPSTKQDTTQGGTPDGVK